MRTFVTLIIFVIGSSAASESSLNDRVDEILEGVTDFIRNGQDSVALQNFEHPFAFEFFGRKLPGTLSGTNGIIRNIHALERLNDTSIQQNGNENVVSIFISFEDLKVSFKKYQFKYGNFKVNGGVQLKQIEATAEVKLVATPNGDSCTIRAKEVILLDIGKDNVKTKFTGKKLPLQFRLTSKDWILDEVFGNGKEPFLQHVLNAFQYIADNSDINLCTF